MEDQSANHHPNSPLLLRNPVTEEACAIMDASYQLEIPHNRLPGELQCISMLRFTIHHGCNTVQMIRRILVRYLVGSLRGVISGCDLLVPSLYDFPTLQDTRGYGSHVSHPHHLIEFKDSVVEGTYAMVVALVGNRGIEGKLLQAHFYQKSHARITKFFSHKSVA